MFDVGLGLSEWCDAELSSAAVQNINTRLRLRGFATVFSAASLLARPGLVLLDFQIAAELHSGEKLCSYVLAAFKK